MASSEGFEPEIKEPIRISRGRIISGILFTFGVCSVPVVIYSNSFLFKRFCAFHNKALRLNKKTPAEVAILSLLLSFLYTSMLCPIYYEGLLRILGISSAEEILQATRESSKQTFLKNPGLKNLDKKIIFQLDRYFKIEDEQTRAFLKENFGDDIFSYKPEKRSDKS